MLLLEELIGCLMVGCLANQPVCLIYLFDQVDGLVVVCRGTVFCVRSVAGCRRYGGKGGNERTCCGTGEQRLFFFLFSGHTREREGYELCAQRRVWRGCQPREQSFRGA